MALRPEDARFVAAYLENPNGTQAYLRAGYSASNPRSRAAQLRRRSDICAAIEVGQRQVVRKSNVTVERMVAAYARIAFANLDDHIEILGDGSVRIDPTKAGAEGLAEISVSPALTVRRGRTRGRRIRIRLPSKLKALDALARHLGLFADLASRSGS